MRQPYTYTGREWDEAVGLYSYRARYYDPAVGRFVSVDPLLHPAQEPAPCCGPGRNLHAELLPLEALRKDPQRLHPYVYVQNRPTVLTDPTGLGPPCECVFYEELCDRCDRYACVAEKFCRIAGDSVFFNCVRNCLIPKYREHRNPARAIFIDHPVCLAECRKVLF